MALSHIVARRLSASTLTLAAVLALSAAAPVHAQCTAQWYTTPGVAGAAGFNVSGLTLFDPDGAGPRPPVLIVGGAFSSAGGVPVNNIAAWDGATFSPLGSGIIGEVDAQVLLPDGRLVVAGGITSAGGLPVSNVAVWDGSTWSTLGAGFNNIVWALAVSSTGELYAGGMFTASGASTINRVAKWNGSAWVSLGTGTGNGVTNIVYALTPLPNGDIVVGGAFTSAGGVGNRRRVARWGADNLWHTMGAGMDSGVLSLATLSDGTVVAGGIFTYADIGPASRIAHWNGTNWLPMGAGTNAQPLGFLPLPNGHLIAGGHFWLAGSVTANKIAYWDGSAWSAMGQGMDNYVFTLAQLPSGDVIAGGGFSTVDGQTSPCLARWSAAPPAITTQPSNQTACPSGTASLSFTASGASLSYAWQVESPENSGTYVDLSTIGGSTFTEPSSGLTFTFTTAATPVLGVSSITLGGHSSVLRFSAVASNTCESAVSNPATLSIVQCACSVADIVGIGGMPPPDSLLTGDDFNAFINAFAAADSLADIVGIGGLPPPDGLITGDDFNAFINAFATGCP